MESGRELDEGRRVRLSRLLGRLRHGSRGVRDGSEVPLLEERREEVDNQRVIQGAEHDLRMQMVDAGGLLVEHRRVMIVDQDGKVQTFEDDGEDTPLPSPPPAPPAPPAGKGGGTLI